MIASLNSTLRNSPLIIAAPVQPKAEDRKGRRTKQPKSKAIVSESESEQSQEEAESTVETLKVSRQSFLPFNVHQSSKEEGHPKAPTMPLAIPEGAGTEKQVCASRTKS